MGGRGVLDHWRSSGLKERADKERQTCFHRTLCARACSVTSDSATPWTVARRAPLSVGFFQARYWSGLPSPSPGDLPDSGIEPVSPALAGGLFSTKQPGKSNRCLRFAKGNTLSEACPLGGDAHSPTWCPKPLGTDRDMLCCMRSGPRRHGC